MKLLNRFPTLNSFKTHKKSDWRKDIVAGITVAVMLVPQGMAYASLAGMPPIYGLYAGLVPLFLYAVIGTSRQLSIGPVAISALLVLAGVSQIAEPLTPEYISLVILAGFMIGVGQMLMGFMKLGFLVNFISHPVIVGFTSGAAIIIAISQMKDLLGIEIPRFSHIYETVVYIFQNIGQANWVSVASCLGSFFVIALLRRINKAIPGALVVVILSSIVAYYGIQEGYDFVIVKGVPAGLPPLQMPDFNWANMKILIPTVLTVTLIGIVESIGIAKVLQSKHQTYSIRPNQELIAIGVSKIGGSFFLALPSSASFSRSAVNNDSGAQSGIASIVTALIVALTLLFFTPLFYYLPKAVLAAIILFAVKGLFEWKTAKHLWFDHRRDFYMMLTTFIVTLIIGVEFGVLVGVLLSIWMVLYRSSKPHFPTLGKLPNSESFRSIRRFPNAESLDEVLITRFDDQLYFGNSNYFVENLKNKIERKGEKLELVILDAGSIHDMDSTGMEGLKEIINFLEKKKIKFHLTDVVGPVRDFLKRTGLSDRIGIKNQFLNNQDAMNFYIYSKKGKPIGWSPDALQYNEEEE